VRAATETLTLSLHDALPIAPYWSGLREGVLRVQRCSHCQAWQFGPEWICHACLRFDPAWAEVEPVGRIYSWERVWHPVHPALKRSEEHTSELQSRENLVCRL